MKHSVCATPRRRVPVIFFLALLLLPVHAEYGLAATETSVWQSGALPKQGRVVLRSGLAWLDETHPVFQKLAADFSRQLTAYGLTVVSVAPSKILPMPETPMPQGSSAREQQRNLPGGEDAQSAAAEAKAAELGRDGKLPKLTLRRYTAPKKDADLPTSVKDITPPDVTRALYARSQITGNPVVDSFSIPGRIPEELTADARVADYAVVIRFATVRGRASAPPRTFHALSGTLLAAARVTGSAPLGFGAPAPPAPPGRSTYGTPGGYLRGYEGPYPNDFWHRDKDFYQRDYMFKHGTPPNHATPPANLSPGRSLPPGTAPLPGDRRGLAFARWQVLMLDAFALAPVRDGKNPEPVWQAIVRKPEDGDSLEKALPHMARAVFADRR